MFYHTTASSGLSFFKCSSPDRTHDVLHLHSVKYLLKSSIFVINSESYIIHSYNRNLHMKINLDTNLAYEAELTWLFYYR